MKQQGTAAAARLPSVSVVIPARNAEATIATTLDSVLAQDYAGSIEIIVADGSETPAMSELVRRLYPSVRQVPNPERVVGFGIRTATQAASGEIIVRCDAHAFLSPGYVRRAVETLERTNAGNVGGRQRPIGTTFFERAVALAMTTVLGAGGARYRLGGPEGPVDTVFLGVFRRKTLDEVGGGVDPFLIRGEDYELNWRLREHGYTVWFDPELEVVYRPRGTLRALARQYFEYGRWKRKVILRHPRSMLPRHLIGALVAPGLAASVCLALAGAFSFPAALALSYFLVLAAGSLAVGIRRCDPAAVLLPLALAAMHVSWGVGFFFPVRSGQAAAAAASDRKRSEPKTTVSGR